MVKVGSGVLAGGGSLDRRAVGRIAREIASARTEPARELVLVSSGAVASGFGRLGLKRMPRTIVAKQAAAAIGQPELMQAYSRALSRSETPAAQVLLTADDLHHRQRFLNARHTIDALLKRGVLPIVNENDSVTFDEIRVGDNDRLSALVATLIGADLLVILSTVPGIKEDGGRGPVIPVVRSVDGLAAHVGSGMSETGTGGMATKVQAATLASDAGIATVIADGRRAGALTRILAGEAVGTLFPAHVARDGSRKRWIRFAARVAGTIVVDEGAKRAVITRGASLLPSGVRRAHGRFEAGATVAVSDEQGRVFAKGVSSYSDKDVRTLAGCASGQIARRLGYVYAHEIIHRNDMTLVEASEDDQA